MPNWCNNDVIIECKDASVIERIAETLTGVKGKAPKNDKDRAVPCDRSEAWTIIKSRKDYSSRPMLGRLYPDFDENSKDGGEIAMPCAWNDEKLGTKWDICNCDSVSTYYNEKRKRHVLSFWFDSPWGPPDLAFYQMAKCFPEVRIRLRYEEPGMDLKGSLWFNKGKCTYNSYA